MNGSDFSSTRHQNDTLRPFSLRSEVVDEKERAHMCHYVSFKTGETVMERGRKESLSKRRKNSVEWALTCFS